MVDPARSFPKPRSVPHTRSRLPKMTALKTIDKMTDAPPGTYFFGEPWPSGICDEGERVQTPDGCCFFCETPLAEGDQGSFLGNGIERIDPLGTYLPVHRECSLRSVLGGIKHVLCVAHSLGDCEPSEVTYRVSALMVWALHLRLTPVRDYGRVEPVAIALSQRELPASQHDAMQMLLRALRPALVR